MLFESLVTIILVLCGLGIYISFIVLLFRLMYGGIKYFKLKNALLSKELYKPTIIENSDMNN